MKILSLFDGMSCGQIALNRAGVDYDGYYASEIDKHAIKVTQANYPETVQLGDITKWQDWAIDWADIGLIMAGSPCQGFSFAGKQLAFDDPRSKLFFVFVDILRFVQSIKPGVKFLLENVKMKKEYQQIITDIMGVEPIEINSALVSAQNRKRLYWANWDFGQPEDKGVLLKDVVEDTGEGFIKSHGVYKRKADKSQCIDANYHKGTDNHGQRTVICGSVIGRKINPETGKRDDHNPHIKAEQRVEAREDEKTNCLTTVQKDNVLVFKDKSQTILSTIYKENAKSMVKRNKMGLLVNDMVIRKLTPIECERLQTVPDNYTNHVSNTQRYKMLGNGWTVDVIAHILKGLKEALK